MGEWESAAGGEGTKYQRASWRTARYCKVLSTYSVQHSIYLVRSVCSVVQSAAVALAGSAVMSCLACLASGVTFFPSGILTLDHGRGTTPRHNS